MSGWGNSGWSAREEEEERHNTGDHLKSCARDCPDGWTWSKWNTHNWDHCHQCRWERDNSSWGAGHRAKRAVGAAVLVGALYASSKGSSKDNGKLSIWK